MQVINGNLAKWYLQINFLLGYMCIILRQNNDEVFLQKITI